MPSKTGGEAYPEAAKSLPSGGRFLLLKAYGAGFWFDMDQVIGGLLLAEMTGRSPVVYWGKNSLYGGSDGVNAFEAFFQPVSADTIHDLMRHPYTVCPAMWHTGNLLTEESPRLLRVWWHPLEAMLARPENILVVGRAPVQLIQPWLPDTHPAFGSGPESIYRYVAKKYLRLQPRVVGEIDDFYAAHLAGRQILAVHMRGSDKITEIDKLHGINKLYYGEIEQYLTDNPAAVIFLMTESAPILEEYKRRFKARLIYTDCQRTGDDAPIHHLAADKIRMGREVLRDVYLAIRCAAFLGNAHSNVSQAVARLKPWPAGSVRLLSVNDLARS